MTALTDSSATETELDRLTPELERLSSDICSLPLSVNDKLTLAVNAAAHFIGTAAALLQQIAKQKGGPVLDAAGWSEEVMHFIVRLTKEGRH